MKVQKNVPDITKMRIILSIILPLSFYIMYLPIWNGYEFHKSSFDILDIIQIIAFVLAVINCYCTVFKKRVINQTIFIISMVISAILLCFFGIFFIENLMGIPLFPPQD